jgi:hypothetical protein
MRFASPFFIGSNLVSEGQLPDFTAEKSSLSINNQENACLQKMLQASYWIYRTRSLLIALNSVETKLPIKQDNYYQGTGAATVRQ